MTSPLHLHRVHEAGVVRSHMGPNDVAAWVDEVRPILVALHGRAAAPSAGHRRWLTDQLALAGEAIDALDHELTVAEECGHHTDDLHWLHTRVCALLEGLHRVAAPAATAA